jgi:glycosyltransferase involved in cell wall biosynthesis
MGRLESAALAEFDLIFVQTETEKRWIDRISKGSLTKQTRVVTNGVNQTLFKKPIESGKPSFLFFGDMSGIYDDLVIWLLKNVWVILRESVPNSNFHLIGKNASDNVLKLVHDDPLVNYQSYVENIEDVFLDKGIMLAPVFKDFGVINKVLESMAAGVPVVGDRTAFNGIVGFQNATHGIIADSPADMAAAAKRLVSDANLYEEIAAQARSLMQDNFSWGSRIAAFDHGIRDVLRDQSK